MLQPEGRADGEDPLPQQQPGGRAKLDWLQAGGIDLDERDVGLMINADDVRRQQALVCNFHHDVVGFVEHVGVP